MRSPTIWVCLAITLAPAVLACRETCPPETDGAVTTGWTRYRAGDFAAATVAFRKALDLCRSHLGAKTGLGYSTMQQGRAAEAERLFDQVLEADSTSIDALIGRGLLAWRAGDLPAVGRNFARVQALEPDNPTAADYLSRLPPGLGSAPDRPPFVQPDSTDYWARTNGDRFEVRTTTGWRPFFIKGVNLGAALPGRHPSEFPDSTVYVRWIEEMTAMGANTVRVYTIHPPWFYQALDEYNRRHVEAPLWLVHGVWAELPPDHDYQDATWEGEFFGEMRHVVDLLHGRSDIAPRPGHASGFYTADVSRWTLAYIIGREWEPYSVIEFDARHPGTSDWSGHFLRVVDGTASDVWMARACEYLIAYEMNTYRAQRPVAYTNWPTLDALNHPTETTVDEELAIREALGEKVGQKPLEYDNDGASLDARKVQSTAQLPAGYFASFHAYPYYPDFMVLDSRYRDGVGPEGRSNYFAYLRRLKQHHSNMPVVISEYGVPASLGIAHLQNQGWHHGGLDEAAMAQIDSRLTREIAAAGMAGGIVFAWIDEWFKKNWIVIDFEIPLERNRLWYNRLDAEQHFGMVAMEPEPRLAGKTLAERRSAWDQVAPLYQDGGWTVRALADEAYLWLLVDGGTEPLPAEIMIGLDMVEPNAGQFRWPDRAGPRLPVGMEFVVRRQGREVRLLADPASNPFRMHRVRNDLAEAPLVVAPTPETRPPGFFTGRFEQRFNMPYLTQPRYDGRYDSLRVITNRPRFGRDGTEYAALGYDRGILPVGEPPDGLWLIDSTETVMEVRLPWTLINVTDPSQRRILQDQVGTPARQRQSADNPGLSLGTVTVPHIGIVVAARDSSGVWYHLPESRARRDVARFQWPTWDTPRWRARRRPVYWSMKETFAALEPAVLNGGASPR